MKLKQDLWFQLGGSMQRNNLGTSKHCVRYSQRVPEYLGVLRYAKTFREIIDGPIQCIGTRNPVLIIQVNSTLLIQYGGLIRIKYV